MAKYFKILFVLLLPILVLAGCSTNYSYNNSNAKQDTANENYNLHASVMNDVYNGKQIIVVNQVISQENLLRPTSQLNKELADDTFLFINMTEKLMTAQGYKLTSTDTTPLGAGNSPKGNYLMITLVFELNEPITSPHYG